MATLPKHLYSFEEYLEQERDADFKSEYRAGEICAMSGGRPMHSKLAVRMIILLDRYVPESCSVYDSNLRLYIEQPDMCVYPDAMAICGEEQLWNGHPDVVTNPHLVVEVLSPSTARYDRNAKSDYYRTIPTLQHLLLVAQDRVLVDWFVRQDNRTWTVTRYEDRTDALAYQIPVGEIYRGLLP